MNRTAKAILAGVALLGAWIIIVRPPPPADIHAEIQQRLLEAELGSATSFHFAAPSRDPAPDATPTSALLNDLRAARPETRWRAAKQLAVRRDPRAVEAVIRAMRDPAGTVRVCVMASVLGHLQDPRALGALTEAAFDSGNRDLRLCAIQSLGMIGDRRAVPALIEAAADPRLRLFMVRALGELGSADALSYLSTLERDPEITIRQAVREARWKIHQLSAADPVQALSAVLREEGEGARRMWAAFRLGELRQPVAIPALVGALQDPVRAVRGRAAAALIRMGAPALPAVSRLAVETGSQAPVYALTILGYIGGAEEIILLRSLAAASREEVRLVVIRHSLDLIQRFSRRRDGLVEFARL